MRLRGCKIYNCTFHHTILPRISFDNQIKCPSVSFEVSITIWCLIPHFSLVLYQVSSKLLVLIFSIVCPL